MSQSPEVATDDTLLDPLVRAVVLARGLRETFALDEQNVAYLLDRWCATHDIPLHPARLTLAIRMVFSDPPPAPLTKKEAQRVIAAALADFGRQPDLGRATLRAWCHRRGGMTGTQIQRLIDGFNVAVAEYLEAAPQERAA